MCSKVLGDCCRRRRLIFWRCRRMSRSPIGPADGARSASAALYSSKRGWPARKTVTDKNLLDYAASSWAKIFAMNSTPTDMVLASLCCGWLTQTTLAGIMLRRLARAWPPGAEADVDAQYFTRAQGCGNREFHAKAGGADILGLSAEITGSGGFEHLDGPGLLNPQTTTAFDALLGLRFLLTDGLG